MRAKLLSTRLALHLRNCFSPCLLQLFYIFFRKAVPVKEFVSSQKRLLKSFSKRSRSQGVLYVYYIAKSTSTLLVQLFPKTAPEKRIIDQKCITSLLHPCLQKLFLKRKFSRFVLGIGGEYKADFAIIRIQNARY